MIQPKTKEEIAILRDGGRRHAEILAQLSELCVPGASSFEIEDAARELCASYKVEPVFLNYQPDGAAYPYPAAICFSVNDEIVHGIPNRMEKILRSGDVVSIDIGIKYNGLITDAAISVPIGKVTAEVQNLLETAQRSLDAGIASAVVGKPVSNIGTNIERVVKDSGEYAIYRGLVGHGVGYDVHEEPNIPNYTTSEKYPIIPAGAVLAIEPMIGLGSRKFVLDREDEWTYRTFDGSVAVHVEHTIAATENGPIILTSL